MCVDFIFSPLSQNGLISKSFLVGSLQLFKSSIMPSVKRDDLTSFLSFNLVSYCSKTLSSVLNKTEFIFFWGVTPVAIDFPYMALIMLRCVPSIPFFF